MHRATKLACVVAALTARPQGATRAREGHNVRVSCRIDAGGPLRIFVRVRPVVVLGLMTIATSICVPFQASANEREVRAAVLEVVTATAGSFGDEGTQLLGAIDALEAALARWDAALQALEVSVRKGPQGRIHEHLDLAAAYLYRGRAAEALAVVNAALTTAPQDPSLHRQRGLVLDVLGETSESAQAFSRAWTLGSQDGVTTVLAFRGPFPESTVRDARAARALSGAYDECVGSPAAGPAFPPARVLEGIRSDAPLVPLSIYARAYAHLAHGAFAEAVAEFRRVSTIDPLVADRAMRLPGLIAGVAALRRGELRDAHRHLEAVRAEAPDSSEVHRILGLTYLVAGDRARSLEHLNTAIRFNPSNERARVAMARTLFDAGQVADAERVLLETLQAAPDSRVAQWWLGWVYEQTNQLSEARAHLARAAGPETLAGRHRVWSAAGRLARVQGDFSDVVPAFERAVRAEPNDVLSRKELAFAYIEQDRPLEALRELVAACSLAPADPDVHALVGRIYLDADRAEAAVPALRRALELSPGHADARYALATALLRVGDPAAAAREREIFDRASRASIDARRRQMAVDVLAAEAEVRTAEGLHDRAVALWQRVLEAEPGRPAHLRNLAAAQMKAGRTLDAILTYEKTVRVDGSPDVYRRLAELYAQVGRHDDSRRALKMAEGARPAVERSDGR